MPKIKKMNYSQRAKLNREKRQAEQEAEVDTEILDLTESSDEEEMKDIDKAEPVSRRLRARRSPRPTGLIVNTANMEMTGHKPATVIRNTSSSVTSQCRSKAAQGPSMATMFMKSIAADMEAKAAAKKKQDYIASFLAKPAEPSLAYLRSVNPAAYPYPYPIPQPIVDLTQEASPRHTRSQRFRQQMNQKPYSFPEIFDLAKKSSVATTNNNLATNNVNTKVNPNVQHKPVDGKVNSKANGKADSEVDSEVDSKAYSKADGKINGKTDGKANGNSGQIIKEFETGYKCMRCLKFFQTRACLKSHNIKEHSDVLNFKCGKCSEVYSTRDKLESHEKTHGRDKTYVCVQCQMSFYQLDNLRRHEKIHEEKKEFKCTGCSRVYNTMEKLVVHERLHQKHKLPFQCTECDEGFLASGNLKMHVRSVHTKKGKKKY